MGEEWRSFYLTHQKLRIAVMMGVMAMMMIMMTMVVVVVVVVVVMMMAKLIMVMIMVMIAVMTTIMTKKEMLPRQHELQDKTTYKWLRGKAVKSLGWERL